MDEARSRQQFYGRRRGRPLRTGQRERRQSLLPQVSVALPENGTLDPKSLFPTPPREVWLEIGFGGGEHLAEQAERHPEIGFIGCEVFENGVVKLLGEIAGRGLVNTRIHADDARPLLAALAANSLGRVFVLFPDPWPKARHAKRRFVHPAQLPLLARLLKPGAEWRVASDDPTYQAWVTDVMAAQAMFHAPPPVAERPDGWPPTRYEAKALREGRVPRYWTFRCRETYG